MKRRFAAALALAAALARSAAGAEPELRVSVKLDRDSVVLHQQLLLSIEVMHPAGARASWEAPAFDGFWAERLSTRALPDDPSGLHRTEFRRALFPTRTGELVVAPSKLEVVGENGPPHDVSVPGARVQVRALPANVPPDALVGHLDIHVSAADERVRLGKSIVVAIELAGDANVWDAPAPNLESLLSPDVDVFPEPPRESIAESSGRAVARRTFRYALVPSHTGVMRMAALEVPYFDPASGKLETARGDALAFDVFEGPVGEDAHAFARRPARPADEPLPLGWLFGAAGLAALAGAVLFARLRRGGFAQLVAPGGAAVRSAFDAASAARGGAGFHALLARAVRAGVEAKHRFDAQALTPAELAARGAEREAVELLEALERARFAGRSADDGALLERTRAYLGL
ncbi:MAG TPA: hypothetical protein VMR31_04180 [Myxococcota bacterium]|nr:hypothetical protein [Myxococcota bacterium]